MQVPMYATQIYKIWSKWPSTESNLAHSFHSYRLGIYQYQAQHLHNKENQAQFCQRMPRFPFPLPK